MPSRILLLLSLLLLPAMGRAQTQRLSGFELERLQLEPSGLGSLVVATGRILPAGVLRASVQAHYEQLPLAFSKQWNPSEGLGLVERRLTVHAAFAYGVLPWLQLDAQLPYIIWQTGSPLLDVAPPVDSGMGTPWVGARAALLQMRQGAPMNVALEVSAGLPLGSAEALGRERYAVLPRLQLGFQGEGFQVGGEVGAYLRPRHDLRPVFHQSNAVLDDELRLGATITSLGATDTHTRREVSVLLSLPLTGGGTTIEVLVGVRKHTLPGLDLYVLGGPSIGNATDSPSFRVLAGASFATGEAD
ncbi:MAG TPA: flagellar motor protein MotB [Myxococcaceae bacterium]|nr:flagellar motor protein MotB [Myxococcaceae bacterium]